MVLCAYLCIKLIHLLQLVQVKIQSLTIASHNNQIIYHLCKIKPVNIYSSTERTSLAHTPTLPLSERTEQYSAQTPPLTKKNHQKTKTNNKKTHIHPTPHQHPRKPYSQQKKKYKLLSYLKVTAKQLLKLVIPWAKLSFYLSILLVDLILIERTREMFRKIFSWMVNKGKNIYLIYFTCYLEERRVQGISAEQEAKLAQFSPE